MATSNFIFREEWLTFTEDLEIQEQNNVIRAIIAYAFDRELPEMSKAESVAFQVHQDLSGPRQGEVHQAM